MRIGSLTLSMIVFAGCGSRGESSVKPSLAEVADVTSPAGDASAVGATALDDAGATALDDAGTTALDDAGTTALDDAGTTALDDAGTTALDDAGTTTLDDAGTTTLDDAGVTSDAGCIATVPINTSSWKKDPHLQVQTATTTHYACTWTVNDVHYDYTTCDGWISDTFFTVVPGRGQEWAVVGWNLATNAMYTKPSGTNAYNDTIARDCAKWAVQTTFAGGNVSNLDIRH